MKTTALRKWKMGLGATGLIAVAGIVGFLGLKTQGYFIPHDETPPAAVVLPTICQQLSDMLRTRSCRLSMIRSQPKEMTRTSGEMGDQGDPSEQLPPEFRRFFGEGMPKMQPRQQPQQAPRGEGMGSGVIIDSSGIIMTNNHVVQGGGKITVRLHDGREFPAVEVKTDPKTDIAIVRIECKEPLKAAKLSDSDAVQIGDWVLAVVSPSVCEKRSQPDDLRQVARDWHQRMGKTSCKRMLPSTQATAAGPLVNVKGEVVGINTAISSRSGGNEGIGFAVPANVAKWVRTTHQQGYSSPGLPGCGHPAGHQRIVQAVRF